ncbi:carboxymuconolactone decarboxylase family protein [Amycolatopsis acidicola]|uniref:Carboxymuconolactone decarboxylase family protein n=1 Tax=Amycolatopsis acidicola TaxID=2596893 RepID=A0A5N0V0C9_9PSEU|nr:carboxymuconolactone decarboxylase family protein [Amycolatopsis acidicola]KAA9156209.1 carboxymuconolactone decarboxylase family protein [Amycolatopsis acidicola]
MRLPPLPAHEWDDRTRAALAGLVPRERQDPEGAGPALSTVVRHPDLAKVFFRFSTYLMTHSTLPPRLRELTVLRVARRRSCAYEWVHHARFAARLGISRAEVAAASEGRSADPFEETVLAAVDELDETSTLSDKTWAALGEHLDERQRMDLVFTIGGYCLMAMAFNTFGIEADEEA